MRWRICGDIVTLCAVGGREGGRFFHRMEAEHQLIGSGRGHARGDHQIRSGRLLTAGGSHDGSGGVVTRDAGETDRVLATGSEVHGEARCCGIGRRSDLPKDAQTEVGALLLKDTARPPSRVENSRATFHSDTHDHQVSRSETGGFRNRVGERPTATRAIAGGGTHLRLCLRSVWCQGNEHNRREEAENDLIESFGSVHGGMLGGGCWGADVGEKRKGSIEG